MDKIRIRGGRKLKGTVPVSGSKNAALPILVASLLTSEKCHFSRVANLQDIHFIVKVLEGLGAESQAHWDRHTVDLQTRELKNFEAPYDLVRKMRASVLVLGPLLARFGKARVSLPGGCAIGARPINFHLAGFEKLGATIELSEGYVVAHAKRLRGDRVRFEFPSVGATENLMLAASLAQGETVLENCAKEPEISNLAACLVAMGAEVEGAGTSTIRIQGRDSLGGCDFEIMGDRIEAGTYLAAGAITQGDVQVEGIDPQVLSAVLEKFEQAGAVITRGDQSIRLTMKSRPKSVDVTTAPYPGFPTDMQAQFMALMMVADGASIITETIFENRFMHVAELLRLGGDIVVRGKSATVRGSDRLKGAPIMATDLRASASLILAGLASEGETIVSRVYHLDRGYESLEKKLQALGAEIERV